jgi:MFS transporter, FSR family, fosmidomycin resistance protein
MAVNDGNEMTLQPGLPLDRRAVGLLTVGHCLIDFSQGAVAALIPFFKATFHLSYAEASILILASSLASSIIQPIFGHYADRTSASWLLPAAILLSIVGVVAAALSTSYWAALAAVAVNGIGVAAFHPEAARLVHFAAGSRLTTAMSYFSVGGGLGFASAPLIVSALLTEAGPSSLLGLIGPAVILAAMFAIDSQRHAFLVQRHENGAAARRSPAQWGAFALLGITIAVRSSVFVGLNAFLALYWVNHLGQTSAMGNAALSVVLGSSVAGTLIGGRLADRYSRRGVLQWGMLAAAGLFGLLAAVENAEVAMALLFPAGLLFALASSPLIVLGQQYLPGRVGVASGITIGLAVSSGGATAPILGKAADMFGIEVILWLLTGLALLAAGLAFLLPRPAMASRVVSEDETA